MAKAVTLKNNNNEEVYPVTDLSLVNGNIPTGRIADNAITTGKIANGAVTSAKINWTTMSHVSSVGASSNTQVSQTTTTLNEVTIPETGVYFATATIDPNTLNADLGNASVFLALNGSNAITGTQVYFNRVSGQWFFGGCSVSAIISCNKGDKVQLRGFCERNHWEVGDRRRLDAFRIG